VVLPIYDAAYQYGARLLTGQCAHFLLKRFAEVVRHETAPDAARATLLHVLEHTTFSREVADGYLKRA